MNSVELRAHLSDVRGLLDVEYGDGVPVPSDHLRECAHAMTAAAELLMTAVRASDEAELVAARARVAEIEARMNILPSPIAPAPRAETKPSPAPLSDYAQTDAGMGVGGREPAQSAQGLRDELAELKERTAEKRRRLRG